MTVLQIVNKLNQEGYNISYRIRSDGGILVTAINGVKYKGATGNAIVRSISGVELEKSRSRQLASINPRKRRAKVQKLDKNIIREIRRTQALYRKRRKETGKDLGTVSTANVRWLLEHEGRQATMQRLYEAQRYAQGLAYDKNIEALIGYIYELSNQVSNSDRQALLNLIEQIDSNRDKIKEEDILPTYQLLYQANEGVPIKDIVKQIKSQLKLK